MKPRNELQIERGSLSRLFETMQTKVHASDTFYCLGALHVLEWVLNGEGKPISELILFKYKIENP